MRKYETALYMDNKTNWHFVNFSFFCMKKKIPYFSADLFLKNKNICFYDFTKKIYISQSYDSGCIKKTIYLKKFTK